MENSFTQNEITGSGTNTILTARKKRSTITSETLKRIRKSFEKNMSAKHISEDLELSLQTVYNIVNKISEGMADEEILAAKKGRKKGTNPEIKSLISQLLMRDSSYTQGELLSELSLNGIVKAQSTISRTLKEMKYTRKRLVKIPEERNSQRNIENRQLYGREIEHINDANLVFLDETGINLHTTRNYGYSPVNAKAYKIVKASKGINISCLVAIKRTGVVCFDLKNGAYNGDEFILFINNHLVPHFTTSPADILIMDNCRFHHRKDVLSLLTSKGIAFRFTPPYSPQLNPIEEYFSYFKSKVASYMSNTLNRNDLQEIIRNLLNEETVDFSGWFRNMRRYVEKALARQEFI